MKIYEKLQKIAIKYLEKFKKAKKNKKDEEVFKENIKEDLEVKEESVKEGTSKIIDIKELYRLHNEKKEVKIDKLELNYHRLTMVESKFPVNETMDYLIWEYSEQFILNRENETLEQIQRLGPGCIVTRNHYIEGGVSALLDKIYEECIFENIKGNPPEAIEDPLETKDYTISVYFNGRNPLHLSGSYDKNGLPEDWPKLAKNLLDFIEFYGLTEMLNPAVYKKVKRKAGEYIYCSVEFSKGGKTYYYLAEDDSFKPGDFVFVPVGNNGHKTVVKIVDIEYASEDNVPYPIEETKWIIEKCTFE